MKLIIFICIIMYRYIFCAYVYFFSDCSSTELPPVNEELKHRSVQASVSLSLSNSRKQCSSESERQPEANTLLRNCYLVHM